MSHTHAIAGTLTRYEHYRDRESPASYSWLTGESWHLSFPLILTAHTRVPGWEGDVPEMVAQIFEYLLQRLEGGLVLYPGTVIDCGVNPPWDFFPRAFVCVPVNNIPGVPIAPDTLALVGLHAGELDAMARVGKGRLLSHLGRRDESQGYSRSTDWLRPSLFDWLGLETSELTKLKCVRTPDWSCASRRSGLTIRLQEPGDTRAAAELANLKTGEAMVFLMDPAWEFRPVPPWPPPPVTEERPAVVGAWSQAGDGTGIVDGMSPAFLAVGLAEDTDSVANLEDGYVLWLRPLGMAKFIEAITKRQQLDHDLPDHTILRIRVVRIKSAPVQVDAKDLPPPERPAVPMPSPTFAPAEKWHTFTSPFKRVYPRGK